jgi:hypothetical protein
MLFKIEISQQFNWINIIITFCLERLVGGPKWALIYVIDSFDTCAVATLKFESTKDSRDGARAFHRIQSFILLVSYAAADYTVLLAILSQQLVLPDQNFSG